MQRSSSVRCASVVRCPGRSWLAGFDSQAAATEAAADEVDIDELDALDQAIDDFGDAISELAS